MRDQYAGDVSDVVKFALLRSLVGKERRLGVAWYYVPGHDGSQDGRHLEWRDEPAWRLLDEELYSGLATLPERSVAALEQARIWPNGVVFHREPMPAPRDRSAWGIRKRNELDGADVVFLDPDIGIGREGTESYATFSEVRLLRRAGRAVIFISFPRRNTKHDALVQQLHEGLAIYAGARNVATLRTNVSVPRAEGSPYVVQRPRWFTIVDPDVQLMARSRAFAKALASVPRVRAQLDYLHQALPGAHQVYAQDLTA
jgi:hypothetical protein